MFANLPRRFDNTKWNPINERHVNGYTYCLDSLLEEVNSCKIYEGRRDSCNDKFTIKVISHKDIIQFKREEFFIREQKLLSNLSHRNILTYSDIFSDSQNWYLITEMGQKNLEDLFKGQKPLNQADINRFARSIFLGLRYLLTQQIVHCDIRPENIVIFNDEVKISNFQYAFKTNQRRVQYKFQRLRNTKYSDIYSRQCYGPKTDVWSFGVILLEMWVGRKQCSEDLIANSAKNVNLDKGYYTNLASLIQRCLDTNLSTRISIEQIEKSDFISSMCKNIQFQNTINKQNKKSSIKGCENFMQFLQAIHQERIRSKIENQFIIPTDHLPKNKENSVPRSKYNQKDQKSNDPLAEIRQNMKKFKNQIKSTQSLILEEDEEEIISRSITYEEALGLINYCRISIYVARSIGKLLKNQIGPVALRILSNIILKVKKQQIIYKEDIKDKQLQKLLYSCEKYHEQYKKQNFRVIQIINFENLPALGFLLMQHLEQYVSTFSPQQYFDFFILYKFINLSFCLEWSCINKNYSVFGQINEIDFKKGPVIDSNRYATEKSKFFQKIPSQIREAMTSYYDKLH